MSDGRDARFPGSGANVVLDRNSEENGDGPAAVKEQADLANVRLSADARALIAVGTKPADLVDVLLGKKLEVDAVRQLAHVMPVRRSVWWACLAAWHGCSRSPGSVEGDALRAAVAWVKEPTAENRQRAAEAADIDKHKTPASCCARAASLAGAQSEPDGPFVPDKVLLAARMAETVIFLAAAQDGDPTSHRKLIELGRQVQSGELPWDNEPAPKTEKRFPSPLYPGERGKG